MMKKFFKLLSLIAVIGAVLVLAGFTFVWANPAKYGDTFVNTYTKQTVTEQQAVTSLELFLASDEVRIYPTDGQLSIVYYELEDNEYTYTYVGGKSTLVNNCKFKLSNALKFGARPAIEIYLPQTQYQELAFTITSGQLITFGGNYETNRLSVSASSGKLKLAAITAETSEFSVASGRIELARITSGSTSINATSGEIELTECSLGQLSFTVSTGEIDTYNLTVDSITGSVTSGSVDLGLSGSVADYTFDCRVTSGEIELNAYGNEYNVRTHSQLLYGNGAKRVNVTLTSGELSIEIGRGRYDD